MKENTHPEYYEASVSCGGCGNSFSVGSTIQEIRINVCSQCHPFYSGKQRFVDSEGRVDAFRKKYEKFQKQAQQ